MMSMAMERDLAVPMRDGTRLFVNLFGPAPDRPYPVIISVTPYGKDRLATVTNKRPSTARPPPNIPPLLAAQFN
jgi:predicted acyl esterase